MTALRKALVGKPQSEFIHCAVSKVLPTQGPVSFPLVKLMSPEEATIQKMSFLPAGKKAQGYLIGMVLASVPIYWSCVQHAFSRASWSWLFLAGVAALVSWFPLRLLSFQDKLWLTLGDVFIFVALFHYDTKVAVVVASVEAVVFNLRKQPKKAYRWAFNLAQNIVVVFLVGRVYEVIDARVSLLESGGIGTIFLLILAPWLCGFLYYTLSSGLTALAVALHGSLSFLEVWTQNFSWFYVSVLGAVLAALTHIAVRPWPG